MSVKFDGGAFRKVMSDPARVRNMAVIAHVDHGKSTLVDAFLLKAGLLSAEKAGKACATDGDRLEKEKGITINSTSVSFLYETARHAGVDVDDAKAAEPHQYVFNCIDSPGHVDFTAEVTSALRVSDGALVLVDCVEGSKTQTKTVLRQAIAEGVKPVLFLNKLDRSFQELQHTPTDAYEQFRKCVAQVNDIIAQNQREGDALELSPAKGHVGFGSGYHGWAFTLHDFAEMYATKLGRPCKKPSWLARKLWGDHFWNPATRQWQRTNPDGALKRGFEQFVLEPLMFMYQAVYAGDAHVYEPILHGLGVALTAKARRCADPKERLRHVMRSWLPAADSVLGMMVQHLPSPVEAQRRRVAQLYPGPPESAEARAIRECDPNGPLVLYVCKMVPNPKTNGFVAFGRVFSGTLRSNQEVYVVSASNGDQDEGSLVKTRVRGVQLMMASVAPPALGSCPAGSLCGVVGLDKCGLVKSGTVSSSPACVPMSAMKFSATPVVRVALAPKTGADLKKLIDGLRKLQQADQLAQTWQTEDGEQILATTGELHKEACLDKLRQLAPGVKFTESRPIVPLMESVSRRTDCDGVTVAIGKSGNKLNRLYVYAEPLGAQLVKDLEAGAVPTADRKALARQLVEQYGWAPDHARRVWEFGLPGTEAAANVLVNLTSSAQYLQEIRGHVTAAFHALCARSALCGEPLRGVRFNVVDAKVHADPAHRKEGQIAQATRRVLSAALLGAGPVLQEPVFEARVACPASCVSAVYTELGRRRAPATDAPQPTALAGQVALTASLPVVESFGVGEALRACTKGEASVMLTFARWQTVESDALRDGSRANEMLLEKRARNRVNPAATPHMKHFHDRI